MKQHRCCLDACSVFPKHIIDMKSGQHDGHDVQTIAEIYQRITESENSKIVKEFLEQQSLESLMAENNDRKQSILKNFAININRIFDDIDKQLAYNWKEHKRIASTLSSISPLYNSDLLSQIDGEFSFLKKSNFVKLHGMTQEQKSRNRLAKQQIEDLAQLTDKIFIQERAKEEEGQLIDRVQNMPIKDNSKLDQVRINQYLQQITLKNQIQRNRIIGWNDDGLQDERLNWVGTIQRQFDYKFESNRRLTIERIAKEFTTVQDMSLMVDICIQFEPNILIIKLGGNGIKDITPLMKMNALVSLTSLEIVLYCNKIKDISPLGELKHLVGLTSLSIYLGNNGLKDITALGHLKALVGLTSLCLLLGQLKDITPLRELKALINLNNLTIDLDDTDLPKGYPIRIISFSHLKTLFR